MLAIQTCQQYNTHSNGNRNTEFGEMVVFDIRGEEASPPSFYPVKTSILGRMGVNAKTHVRGGRCTGPGG